MKKYYKREGTFTETTTAAVIEDDDVVDDDDDDWGDDDDWWFKHYCTSDCMTFNALYVCFISSHEKCFNDFPVWIFNIFPILFLYLWSPSYLAVIILHCMCGMRVMPHLAPCAVVQ